MKHIIKLLIPFALSIYAVAEELSTRTESHLKPLIEAMSKGGLDELRNYLDKGGKWPRIGTEFYAKQQEIAPQDQKELVELAERLLGLLRERAESEPAAEIPALEAEAELLFGLGEILWKAQGYRNHVLSLLCSKLATLRCGRIVLLSRGDNLGPARPIIYRVKDSKEMLNLFIKMMSEHSLLAGSSLEQRLTQKPIQEKTWVELIYAINELEIDGVNSREKYSEAISMNIKPLGIILSQEDISSLVIHYGSTQVMHESDLPALALYLKNGGSLETLLKEPANATKFEKVMKDEVFRFSSLPLMNGYMSGSKLLYILESSQNPSRTTDLLFGIKK